MRLFSDSHNAVRNGTTTFTAITQEIVNDINQRRSLNHFLAIDSDNASLQAQQSDARYAAGNALALDGMVVAVKDNLSTRNFPTTCASKILSGYSPVYDATVVERLAAHGAIIIGKTNMDEFAMGSSGENSAFGKTLHPLNGDYVPGGSSSGSAVAVAAGHAHASLGSDTGGSVRQPAAFCGIVGYKPSYGRLSRYGLVAFASSLDQVGIFAPDIPTTAAVMDALSGHDPNDATSANLAPTCAMATLDEYAQKPLTIAVLPEEIIKDCSPEVLEVYKKCLALLQDNGITLVNAHIPANDAWIPTYYVLATAEASSNLARFDGIRYGFRAEINNDDDDIMTLTRSQGFGMEVKRRIMLGTYVLSAGHYDAYYKKAQQARRLIYDGYEHIFSQADALFLPTTPTTAFKFGEKLNDPIAMYLSDYFTVSANLAGIPAISIPAGNAANGFPVGMQLQTSLFQDERLLSIAHRFQQLFHS
jgi:aspartyl-tRNA(Asn)/glutamyl-tRNA(Gln) amidotransferase subunit A